MNGKQIRTLVLDQGVGVWGAQRYLLRLAPELRSGGIELVLGGPDSLELHDVWLSNGFEAHHLDLPTQRTVRVAGRPAVTKLAREAVDIPRTARLIADCVRRERIDLIWANAHWIHLDAAIAGRLSGKPSVLHLHEETIPGIGTHLRGVAARIAHHSVAVSRCVASGLPNALGGRISVIANGIDTHEYSPADGFEEYQRVSTLRESLGMDEGDVMVLAATRLDPSKRIEDLLSAVATVGGPVKLVIAGETSCFPEYAEAVMSAGLAGGEGRVQFLGRRSDMVELLRAADVLLHAGLVEGMPLGVIEAQSCGTPVVAYASAGVPEVVCEGSTGLLAEPGNLAQLTAALARVVTDGELRIRLATEARAISLERNDIGLQVRENASLLRSLHRRSAQSRAAA